MKKHITWILLVAVGVLLIVGNLVYPLLAAHIAVNDEETMNSIAIIGGADEPTAMFVYSLLLNRTSMALVALGVLSLLAGVAVCISTFIKLRAEKRAKEVSE